MLDTPYFSIIITKFSYNLGVGRLCGNNTGQHMYIGDFASSSIPAVAVILKVKNSFLAKIVYHVI